MESTPAYINDENNATPHYQAPLIPGLQDDTKEQLALLQEQLKNKTRQLEDVNKEFEAFYHAISHDLKAPLRAITGFAGILKEDHAHKFDEEVQRLIETVDANAKKLNLLINELLNFSRISKNAAVFEIVEMNQLVDQCVGQLLTTEQKKEYKIIVAKLPDCTGDAGMLKQVWVNLIGNAIKYSAKKDERVIEIGFEDDDTMHTYFIRDRGTGFDMRYSNDLFNVFQKLNNDKDEGNGMGLAFVKRIIFKHGGSVWVQSVPGEGSTFYFSIPKNAVTSNNGHA